MSNRIMELAVLFANSCSPVAGRHTRMTEPITLPPLPRHPEPHTYVWTKLELQEIRAYGKKCFEAGSKQAEVAALPVGMVEPDAWQPIETAPEDGVPILVANHVRGGSWIACYCPVNSHGCKLINPWQSLMLNTRWHKTPHATTAPTVWQPIPLPPVAASGIRAQEVKCTP